jgi:hypothetical protein
MLAQVQMLAVFPPVPEAVSPLHALLAVACVILGAALLLRGLKLSRPLMAIVGASVGALAAAAWQQAMPDLNALAVYGGCIGGGIVLGALTARFWIGLLAGTTLGTIAMLWVIQTNAASLSEASSPALTSSDAESLVPWIRAIYQDGWNYLRVALDQREFGAIALVGLSFLIPLVLALILRRVATMVVSSIIGAAMILGGLTMLIGFGGFVDDISTWLYSWVMLFAVGVVALAGLIVQIILLFKKPPAPADSGDGKGKK